MKRNEVTSRDKFTKNKYSAIAFATSAKRFEKKKREMVAQRIAA
jgi:hypothetical protein